ncbi:hypothetical protein As57867_006216, partial [Aphanomyces stellatus]
MRSASPATSRTYARQLVLSELTDLTYAVTNLRTLSPWWFVKTNTMFCWIDFNTTFEVAHTVARQARCEAKYKANAAVYIESMLRQQVWADFVSAWGGSGSMWNVTYQEALDATPTGRRWLQQTTTARSITSVAQEVAYWRSFQVDRFQLQWQNHWQTGISE